MPHSCHVSSGSNNRKRSIIARYAQPDNAKGFAQVCNTLVPLAALWYLAVLSADTSYALGAGVALLMTLFLLRVFVLMHDCGHGSLFRSAPLNKAFRFVFGVVSGMPQYVWSQHHNYHHATNGNWAKYRGPLNVYTVEEFAALTDRQRRAYQRARSLWMAPLAGFVYLIFNPRFTWLKGSASLLTFVIRRKISQPGVSIRAHAAEFQPRYWSSPAAYRHMFWNNVVLLSAWTSCRSAGERSRAP